MQSSHLPRDIRCSFPVFRWLYLDVPQAQALRDYWVALTQLLWLRFRFGGRDRF